MKMTVLILSVMFATLGFAQVDGTPGRPTNDKVVLSCGESSFQNAEFKFSQLKVTDACTGERCAGTIKLSRKSIANSWAFEYKVVAVQVSADSWKIKSLVKQGNRYEEGLVFNLLISEIGASPARVTGTLTNLPISGTIGCVEH